MGKKRKADMVEPESYSKLGSLDFQGKKKLRYVPKWIENAALISCDIQRDKEQLDAYSEYLSPSILDRLRRRGFTHLFPVQKLLIPDISGPMTSSLPPRDICISAPTGSGKTLSYVLPMLEILRKCELRHQIRALIVLPVVDLAKQVYEVFRSFLNDDDRLKIALLTGQQDLETDIKNVYERCGRGMLATVDIVVATPGRLLEHLNESGGAFCLKYLRFLIIDEADRLLSDYRIEWFKAVEKAVYGDEDRKDHAWFFWVKKMPQWNFPIKRYRPNVGSVNALFDSGRYPLQKIFLSATLSYDPDQLQRLNLFRPKLFKAQTLDTVNADNVSTDQVVLPRELKEYYLNCSSNSKPLAIFCLLTDHESDWNRVVCFVQSRQNSLRLAQLLTALGLENVKEASASLTRIRRQKLLKRLNNGKIRVLICSDLFARGIDIEGVDCVINYDPPKQILAYVHRAGRTARAGCVGSAVTIADEKEIDDFKQLMEANNRWSAFDQLEIPKERMKELKPKYRDALVQLKKVVQAPKRGMKKYRSSQK